MRSSSWLLGRLVLFSSAVGIGCSGAVSAEPPADAGADGGGGGSGGSGDDDGGGSIAQDGGPVDVGEPAACASLLAQSTTALAPVYAKAQADLSCVTDQDCVLLPNSTSCSFACGAVVNTAGAAALSDAIQDLNATTCGQFAADGCTTEQAPCPGPYPGAAQCIANLCVPGFPAAWISFGLESDDGGQDQSFSSPVQCAGPDCSVWQVLSDGTLYVQKGASQTATKLSSADLATVDGIVRDPEFRQMQLGGPLCDQAAGNAHATFDIEWDESSSSSDVSGCLASGPSGNDFARIYVVLQAY